jgi:Ca2+:H+ antiporter
LPREWASPYGTLLLTLAVTLIEVALIATIMPGEKPQPALKRDNILFGLVHMVVFAVFVFMVFVP